METIWAPLGSSSGRGQGCSARWNPTSPENLATQILYNDEWYAKHQVAAEEMYVDALIN